MSRTKNALKNTGFGMIGKVLDLILAFVARTVFIYCLGSTYLGVNGLYSEILNLLSFAELGFGSALTFAMYKPVANGDMEKTAKLLVFYKKIYRIIALIISLLGIGLLPFLQFIVKGADWLSITELRLFFLIYLFNTVVGYFVSYKFSYLNALQKNYVATNFQTLINALTYTLQVIIVLLFRDFMAYLLVNSFVLVLSRFAISLYLDRKYPIFAVRPGEGLSREEKKTIYKEVRGLAVHQFSSVAVHSTDNILISTITGMGVVAVGLISNYNMLMNSVLGFVTIIFGSVTSGFGNLVATSTTENYHKVFQEVNFLSFWVYGFCSVCFLVLIPPFITLWIGADKVIDNVSFLLIITNCYLQGQSGAFNNARIAKGNFGKDKGWALAQAIVNLVVSIAAGYYLGLVGIYIGTVASRLVYVLFRPYSSYRFLFEESPLEYYKKFFSYFFGVVLAAFVSTFITSKLLSVMSLRNFVLAAVVVVIVTNATFFLLFHNSKEFKSWKCRVAGWMSAKGKHY